MSASKPSALETAVLERFHHLYREKGFPSAESIRVLGRANTGGGRYVDLECLGPVQLDDGYIDLGGSYIEMEGLPNGMMAVALIKDSRVRTLEFTVYGGDSWSGEERDWKIV
jgi:hypothetical protein